MWARVRELIAKENAENGAGGERGGEASSRPPAKGGKGALARSLSSRFTAAVAPALGKEQNDGYVDWKPGKLESLLIEMVDAFRNGGVAQSDDKARPVTLTGNYRPLSWEMFIQAECFAIELSKRAFPWSDADQRMMHAHERAKPGYIMFSFAVRKKLWSRKEPVSSTLRQISEAAAVAAAAGGHGGGANRLPTIRQLQIWRRTLVALLKPGSKCGSEEIRSAAHAKGKGGGSAKAAMFASLMRTKSMSIRLRQAESDAAEDAGAANAETSEQAEYLRTLSGGRNMVGNPMYGGATIPDPETKDKAVEAEESKQQQQKQQKQHRQQQQVVSPTVVPLLAPSPASNQLQVSVDRQEVVFDDSAADMHGDGMWASPHSPPPMTSPRSPRSPLASPRSPPNSNVPWMRRSPTTPHSVPGMSANRQRGLIDELRAKVDEQQREIARLRREASGSR